MDSSKGAQDCRREGSKLCNKCGAPVSVKILNSSSLGGESPKFGNIRAVCQKTLGLCDKKLRQKSYTKWGNGVKP